MQWIVVDDVTSEIVAIGRSHDQVTLDAQPVPTGCTLVLFDHGEVGKYYVNGAMQDAAP